MSLPRCSNPKCRLPSSLGPACFSFQQQALCTPASIIGCGSNSAYGSLLLCCSGSVQQLLPIASAFHHDRDSTDFPVCELFGTPGQWQTLRAAATSARKADKFLRMPDELEAQQLRWLGGRGDHQFYFYDGASKPTQAPLVIESASRCNAFVTLDANAIGAPTSTVKALKNRRGTR